MDFSTVNCCFSAIHHPSWPKYLTIKLQESKRTTRKDNEMMVKRGEKIIFNDQIFTTFNDLPKVIRKQKSILQNCLCNITWHLAFLVLLILNHWFLLINFNLSS